MKPTDRALANWADQARKKKVAIIPYLESKGVRFKKLARKGKSGRAKDAMGRFISQKVSTKSLKQWGRAKAEKAGIVERRKRKAALLPRYSDNGLQSRVVGPKDDQSVYKWREWIFPVAGRAANEKYSTLARLAIEEVRPLLLADVAICLVAIVFLTEEMAEDYRRAWTTYYKVDDIDELIEATDTLLSDFREYQEVLVVSDLIVHTKDVTHKK